MTREHGRHAVTRRRRRGRMGGPRTPQPTGRTMAMTMTVIPILWLAAMLCAVWLMPASNPTPRARETVSALCTAAAMLAPVPSRIMLSRERHEGDVT